MLMRKSSIDERLLVGIRPYLILTILCAVLFLPGLSLIPITDRDEARYAQATKQMIETGDYIDMRIQETAYHKKPVGIQWLQVASVRFSKLVGVEGFGAYRMPSTIGAWGSVLLTFLIGSILFSRSTGFFGAVLLAGSLLLATQARAASTDAMLLLTVTGATAVLAQLYMNYQTRLAGNDLGSLALWAALGFWSALAAGFLLKGPIGPFIVVATLVVLSIAGWNTRWLQGLRPKLGVPLMLALALPWFIAIYFATEGAFYGASLGVDLFQKVVSAQESHGAPIGSHAALLILVFWPASLFVWPGIVEAIRTRTEPAVLFCLAWIVPAWIAFELAPTKLPHYPLPVYPALALLTAAVLLKSTEERRTNLGAVWVKALILIWALFALAWAVVSVVGPITFGDGFRIFSLLPLAAGVAAAVLTVRVAWRGEALRAATVGLALGALSVVLTAYGVVPHLTKLWLTEEIVETLDEIAADRTAPVAVTGYLETSMIFRLGTDTLLTDGPGAAEHLAAYDPAVHPIAIVNAPDIDAFKARLAELGVIAEPLAQIEASNYSTGRALHLTVFKAVGADGG